MSIEALVSDMARLPVAKLVGTPDGMDILANNPDLHAGVMGFAKQPDSADLNIPNLEWVGSGNYSHVWAAGDIAIKLSTHTTGKAYYQTGDPGWPENLIGQFTFMTALGHRLQDHGDGSVGIPDQYFALKTGDGRFLTAQRFLRETVPLYHWQERHGYTNNSPEHLASDEAIWGRLVRSVGQTTLRAGMCDVLRPGRTLQNSNVLVPAGGVDAATGPLYIIDQPSRGVAGKLAVEAARLYLGRQTIPKNKQVTHYM